MKNKVQYTDRQLRQFEDYNEDLNEFLKYKYGIDSFETILQKIDELKDLINTPPPAEPIQKIKAPQYITRAELYKIVGCTKSNLSHWENDGLLIPKNVGGKTVYNFKQTIDTLLSSNKIKYHSNILKNTSHYDFK